MQIDGNVTVAEAMEQLRRDIAEKQETLKFFENLVGKSGPVANGNGANVSNGSNRGIATRIARERGEPTVAERAEAVLEANGKPMAQTAMRDVMRSNGLTAADRSTFLSALYTAMSRKTEIFTRDDQGLWGLVKWSNS